MLASETTTIAIKLRTIPARIICGTLINSEPNTIALGGVATGNMKAQLAAMAMAAVRSIGLNPNCVAIMATIGRKVAVVARLEVSSVKNIIRVLNINTNNIKV